MRIESLKVQNFRCFKEAIFEFAPGFNLLVGINGAGKTSLLTAVAASLATPMNGLGMSSVWLHAEERNARRALLKLNGKVRYERCYPVRLEVKGQVVEQPRAWWMEESGPGSNQTKFEHTIFKALVDQAAAIAQGQPGAMPVVAFYTAERQWKLLGIAAHTAVQHKESRLDAYKDWHNAALDIQGLETWIVAKSLERLESDQQGLLQGDRVLDELDWVNQAVAAAIPEANGLRYDIRLRSLVLDWKQRDPVPFDTLSDGQRGVAALVADVARRMALLNPQLGSQVLNRTPGIVVIDELDMHLHPAWQRRLPGVLKSIFPMVQFIVSAHSPQMMGELEAQEIWLMQGAEVIGHPQTALGLSTDEVLEELMEADSRNVEVAQSLADIRTLLDNDQIQVARCKLELLQTRVGDIPEVIELQSALRSLSWLEDDGA